MSVKECRDCGQLKPITEFWKRKASDDGLALYCKQCFGLRNAASTRKRLAKQGKEVKPYRMRRVVPEGMKYCPQCDEDKPVREFGSNRATKSGLAAYCKPCHNTVMAEIKRRTHGSHRSYLLKLRYGLTAEQVEEHRLSQGGVCVICLRAPARHVDHNHMTGLFRALLCFPCNGAIGQYEDDPWRMREAARYLEGWGSHARAMWREMGVLTLNGRAFRLSGAVTGRARRVATARDYRLRNRYGIEEKDVQDLLMVQHDRCAICCDKFAEHVDHDHVTGVVRGMLCAPCNTGMGQLKDDPISLRRAADYVEGLLIRRLPTQEGGSRLSFTVPDVDPGAVSLDGWEPYRAQDGKHRRRVCEAEELALL
ncbi:endonuclease VII domain-containing protein [Actinomadura viridis]|uniref:Recombination endonuclease VII n=1 Tax=Actinomadura viridis TaxID=58110 RepID=A0A931DH74_9ACTN|nr:endonuclease VII domain-containing protein [Actinomadura viridis]MBG6090010.1 hypothetical protein [Actinomadura viridis]